MQFEEFDEFTRKLCLETGKFILSVYESEELEVELKADDTPVTVADRESERQIREAIRVLYPDHGIKGEEQGDFNPNAAYTWVIDPVDGTKTFAAGCPLFGTMIALLKEGQPVFGCINYPAIGKRISGDGSSCAVNGKPAKARSGVALADATLLTTDFGNIERHQNGDAFDQLARQARLVRTWGDCFGYFLVATGKADIMLDPILNPWDIMALVPILRGSGAAISDWSGGDPAQGASLIAANADLHASIVAALNPG